MKKYLTDNRAHSMDRRIIKINPIADLSLIKSNKTINLAKDKFIASMKLIEESHWEYLDKLCKRDTRLPRLKFFSFMEELFRFLELDQEIGNIRSYYRNYDKYKKSLPTAGGLILNDDNILLIRMYGTRVYSLPKGKAENGELLWQTAIREIREETGLDLDGVLTSRTEALQIHKTKLFIIESDSKIRHFDGYNRNEISEIRWFKVDTILNRSEQFSKQTRAAVNRLINMNYI